MPNLLVVYLNFLQEFFHGTSWRLPSPPFADFVPGIAQLSIQSPLKTSVTKVQRNDSSGNKTFVTFHKILLGS